MAVNMSVRVLKWLRRRQTSAISYQQLKRLITRRHSGEINPETQKQISEIWNHKTTTQNMTEKEKEICEFIKSNYRRTYVGNNNKKKKNSKNNNCKNQANSNSNGNSNNNCCDKSAIFIITCRCCCRWYCWCCCCWCCCCLSSRKMIEELHMKMRSNWDWWLAWPGSGLTLCGLCRRRGSNSCCRCRWRCRCCRCCFCSCYCCCRHFAGPFCICLDFYMKITKLLATDFCVFA